jgi:hypothetical protein
MSDKPKGLAARLNKNIIKNKPSAVLTPTVVVAPEPEPIVPIVEPTRHIGGAWSKGIDSIRGAVNLPNPVIAKPVSTKVSASVLSKKSNKDYLGYITDEDDITDEDEE